MIRPAGLVNGKGAVSCNAPVTIDIRAVNGQNSLRVDRRKQVGKTVSFRPRHRWYSAVVSAAVLLQLHLFFVVQLHRHHTDPVSVADLAALLDGRAHVQVPHAPIPPCPACHIARHGLVDVSPVAQVANSPLILGSLQLPAVAGYCFLLQNSTSSRDPPRS
jgi:hypothetical protein